MNKLTSAIGLAIALLFSAGTAWSDIGPWSEKVDDIRGRLIISTGPVEGTTRAMNVYLELEDASSIEYGPTFFYDEIGLMTKIHSDLLDSKGTKVPMAKYRGESNFMSSAGHLWRIPPGGAIRIKISVKWWGHEENTTDVQLPGAHWAIVKTDTGPYFLKTSITFSDRKDGGERKPLHGTLNLPAARIPQ